MPDDEKGKKRPARKEKEAVVAKTEEKVESKPVSERHGRRKESAKPSRDDDNDSNQPTIGFGQSLPAFMKNDPLVCLK